MKFALAVIAASTIIAAGSADPARAATGMSVPYEDGILRPPTNNGKPIPVLVGLHIVNLSEIDGVKQRFHLHGYLVAQWKDRRLAFTPQNSDERLRIYRPGEIWHPSFALINAVGPRERSDITLMASPDGAIQYVERFRVALSSRFNLRRFPFDSQMLRVFVHPFVSDARVEELLPDSSLNSTAREFDAYSSLASWRVAPLTSGPAKVQTYDGSMLSEVHFDIKVTRRYAFYLWKVFLPLLLMVFLSWAVFWIEPADLDNQIQVGVTTILTVIAFAFAISVTMPQVPYLTLIDAFFLACYIFVFVAILESMTVHVTHRIDKEPVALRIRRVSRWLVPLAFFTSNALLALYFFA